MATPTLRPVTEAPVDEATGEPAASGLSERDHMVIWLATTPYRYEGRREADALDRLGLTPTRFWAAVNRLTDSPVAEREYPAQIRRLRRVRAARQAVRTRGRTSETG